MTSSEASDASNHTTIERNAITRQIEIREQSARVMLVQFSHADAPEIFALIDRNRKHLGPEISDKYPTLESVEQSIQPPEAATNLLAEWAFTEGGYQRLIAITDKDNFASMRVLQKAGFSEVDASDRVGLRESEIKFELDKKG